MKIQWQELKFKYLIFNLIKILEKFELIPARGEIGTRSAANDVGHSGTLAEGR